MRSFSIVSALLIGASAANAQAPCAVQPPSTNVHSGGVRDTTQGLNFVWSATRQNVAGAGQWHVDNYVCNTGPRDLIVTWKKTRLWADAFSPMKPLDIKSNQYTASNPQTDPDSPIIYGLSPRDTSAQTFQDKPIAQTKAPLSSNIFFGSTAPSAPEPIALSISASPNAEGYRLTYIPKNEATNRLSLAISSTQNETLAKAFNNADVRVSLGSFNDFVTERPSKDGGISWAKAMADVASQRLLFIPQRERKSVDAPTFSIQVPVQANRVEVANLILINNDRLIVASGLISIFQP